MNVGVTAATPNSVSISVPEKLSKTDDPDYNPTFDFESSEWKTKYDTIVTASSDIHDIGRLPNLEEFQSLYGYTHPDKMTLTRFRQTYGEGSEFIEPSEVLTIYIANETELDLMSNLVNNTADSETAIEQAYYSTCSYKLMSEIDYTGTKGKSPKTCMNTVSAFYSPKANWASCSYFISHLKQLGFKETQKPKPGDIVIFFKKNNAPGHAGLYVGNSLLGPLMNHADGGNQPYCQTDAGEPQPLLRGAGPLRRHGL